MSVNPSRCGSRLHQSLVASGDSGSVRAPAAGCRETRHLRMGVPTALWRRLKPEALLRETSP